MQPILSYHPFKGIATLLFVAGLPPYLLTLSIWYILPRNRPIQAWSFKTAIGTAYLHIFYRYVTAVRLKPAYASPKLKDKYVLVDPAPPSFYIGVTKSACVEPTPVPAVWLPLSSSPQKKHDASVITVIHLQGGAFVSATDPVQTGTPTSKIYSQQLNARVFWAQYRLSRTENTRFPAALQDLITAYRYILNLGIPPENIILAGDSAGGGLVVGLLRYIEEIKNSNLPPPRGALLWSPWVDVSDTRIDSYRSSTALRTDFLNVGLMKWGKKAFIPRDLKEDTRPYITPVDYPFRCATPIVVNAGGAEILRPEVHLWAKRMRDVQNNKILYNETKDGPHDTIVAGILTGFLAEAEKVVIEARNFFGLEAPTGNPPRG